MAALPFFYILPEAAAVVRYIRPFMHDQQERSSGTRAVGAMSSVLPAPNITCIATLSATEFTLSLIHI